MNFKEILDSETAWKNFEDKDSRMKESSSFESFKNIKVDAEIDLHGMTISEAEKALDNFFTQAKASGFKKILIIHGKGNHSREGGVLKKWVRTYLDRRADAGRRGTPRREIGGRGATWVMIKR